MATAIEQPQPVAESKAGLGSLSAVDVMSAPAVSIRADCSLLGAWDMLRSHGGQHLVVMDGTRVAGVVDASDILLAWSADPLAQSGKAVRRLLRPRTPCVIAHDTLPRTAQTLLRDDLGAVPVVSADGRLVGIVTVTDILRAVAECSADDARNGT